MLLQGGEARSDQRIPDIQAALAIFPEALHRGQLGTIGRPPHNNDVLRPRDALCPVRWSLVQEHTVETCRIMLAQLAEKDGAAGGIEAGQRPPEGVPRGGLHGGIEPVRLLQGLHNLDRLHAVAREPPVDGPVHAQRALVLAEDPPRLGGCLAASGGHGAEPAAALLEKVSRLGDVFFAWLGRGRFRWALSW